MSPQSRSKYQFYQESSLSQKLAHKDKDYTELAGSDPKTSLKIARLKVLARHKLIDLEEMSLIMDLLNAERKARFATSEKVNEITKMGLQMPKAEDEFFKSDD